MGVESVYNHADFRLMSRRALDMLADYEERNLYLRGLIPQIGLQSTTVDDVISERVAGQSKYTLAKMLSLAVNGITAFSTRPLQMLVNMGVLFLIIAFGIGIYVIHAMIAGRRHLYRQDFHRSKASSALSHRRNLRIIHIQERLIVSKRYEQLPHDMS